MKPEDILGMKQASNLSLQMINTIEQSGVAVPVALTGVSILLYGLVVQSLLDEGQPATPDMVASYLLQHAEYSIRLADGLANVIPQMLQEPDPTIH